MIDFHNHILPNVDDGPETIEESIEMLRCAEKQGITDVVNTVHFQHPKMYGKNVDYDYLKGVVNNLQLTLDNINIKIKIHLSAEVFYLPNLLEISSNPLLKIGDGKYMLIEFKSNIYPTGYENEFFKLQNAGITPIVAHPERYRFIQSDIEILDDWINRGYVIQVDAGSITGVFGLKTKDVAVSMLEKNFVHIIGSDAHDVKKRNFNLKEAYDFIEQRYNVEYVAYLKKNSKRVIKGKNIKEIFLYENKKMTIFRYIVKKLINKS